MVDTAKQGHRIIGGYYLGESGALQANQDLQSIISRFHLLRDEARRQSLKINGHQYRGLTRTLITRENLIFQVFCGSGMHPFPNEDSLKSKSTQIMVEVPIIGKGCKRIVSEIMQDFRFVMRDTNEFA